MRKESHTVPHVKAVNSGIFLRLQKARALQLSEQSTCMRSSTSFESFVSSIPLVSKGMAALFS